MSDEEERERLASAVDEAFGLEATMRRISLPAKAVQIQSFDHPGDSNCGPHSTLIVLCEDGSIWARYFSSGFSNVPTDGLWHMLEDTRQPRGGEEVNRG